MRRPGWACRPADSDGNKNGSHVPGRRRLSCHARGRARVRRVHRTPVISPGAAACGPGDVFWVVMDEQDRRRPRTRLPRDQTGVRTAPFVLTKDRRNQKTSQRDQNKRTDRSRHHATAYRPCEISAFLQVLGDTQKAFFVLAFQHGRRHTKHLESPEHYALLNLHYF